MIFSIQKVFHLRRVGFLQLRNASPMMPSLRSMASATCHRPDSRKKFCQQQPSGGGTAVGDVP